MKITTALLKSAQAALILLLTFIISSCDDAGITTDTKKIEFSQANLKPLNKQTEGVYEAWLSLGSGLDHGDNAYVSVGRFNISSSGQLLDTSGAPGSLNLNRVSNVNLTEDAIITIEQPGDNDTIPGTKILGAAKVIENGFIVFNMKMDYAEVLPAASQFAGATGTYMLASPTDLYASFNVAKGLWFSTDTLGNTPGLTLPVLPDTAEWTYQAWVVDNRDSANRIYNIGRFVNPNGADDNQQCAGSNPGWNVPGHDWIQPNCPGGGIPDIDDLTNSNFKLIVTLEPKFETNGLGTPFFIRLFYGNVYVAGPFGSVSTVANSTVLPTAQIRLSVTR